MLMLNLLLTGLMYLRDEQWLVLKLLLLRWLQLWLVRLLVVASEGLWRQDQRWNGLRGGGGGHGCGLVNHRRSRRGGRGCHYSNLSCNWDSPSLPKATASRDTSKRHLIFHIRVLQWAGLYTGAIMCYRTTWGDGLLTQEISQPSFYFLFCSTGCSRD